MNTNWMVTTYLVYLAISIVLTIWVARTLHKNGRVFLVDSFLGNEQLADSVNHLLVVGFYLINIGYVTMALKYGAAAGNAQEALEALSSKVGVVLLVLGGMHFFNLAVFTKMRKRAGLNERVSVREQCLMLGFLFSFDVVTAFLADVLRQHSKMSAKRNPRAENRAHLFDDFAPAFRFDRVGPSSDKSASIFNCA